MDQVPNPIILEIYHFLEEPDRVRFYQVCVRIRDIIQNHYLGKFGSLIFSDISKLCNTNDSLGVSIILSQYPDKIRDFDPEPFLYSLSEKKRIRCFVKAAQREDFGFDYDILLCIMDGKIHAVHDEFIEHIKKRIRSNCRSDYVELLLKTCILFRNSCMLKNIANLLIREHGICWIPKYSGWGTACDFLENYQKIRNIPDEFIKFEIEAIRIAMS